MVEWRDKCGLANDPSARRVWPSCPADGDATLRLMKIYSMQFATASWLGERSEEERSGGIGVAAG